MAITRQSIIDGPGSLVYGTTKLFAKETISATIELDMWRPDIQTHGLGAPRLRDATGTVAFTPAGRIDAALAALYWPAALRTPVPGTHLFGSADVALAIHSCAGKKITFTNAAPTALPEIILSPRETAIGEVTYTCLIGNGLARTATGSFYTAADAAWTEAFDDGGIIAVPYTAVWGTGGTAVTLFTAEGWRVTFDLQTTPRYIDGIGTIDHVLESLVVRASCRPVNLTASSLVSYLRPEGLALGATMRQSKDLVITGATGGLVVTLYDAVCVAGPCQWGKSELRAGEVGFEASARIASSTMGAIFAVAIA